MTGRSDTSNEENDTPTAERFVLRVRFVGDGMGIVRVGGQVCESDCERDYPAGGEPPVHAVPANGSDSHFGGFGGSCSGLVPECRVLMDGPKEVTVDFRRSPYNLVFVSSTTPSSSRSGAARYDEDCNQLATTAGINNATNDAFVAWTSDHNSLAIDRLGTTARGFMLLDGKPFADGVADLLAGEVLYPIRLDEKGREYDATAVRTGTEQDGGLSADRCNDYTSESTDLYTRYGLAGSGPVAWTSAGRMPCGRRLRVYCLMNTKVQPLEFERETGKYIFLTNELYVPGPTTPDEACDASKPAGSGPAQALLAFTGHAAAERLDPEALYVRPDGIVVGTGAEIIAASRLEDWINGVYLETGIWQLGNGAYPNDDPFHSVWVGDSVITRAPAAVGCSNWTDASPESGSRRGDYTTSTLGFWNVEDSAANCSNALRLYCVEQ